MKRWQTIALVGLAGSAAVILIVPLVMQHRHHHGPLYRNALRRMVDGAISYYQQERAAPDGSLMPPTVPESTAPIGDPCGEPVVPAGPTWAALHVGDPIEKMRLSYTKEADNRFLARVFGDLDCDGRTSTFEHRCEVSADDYDCAPFHQDEPE